MIHGLPAIILLAVLTLAMLYDVANGNTQSFGQWGQIIIGSIVLTVIGAIISNATNKKKEQAQKERPTNPSKLFACPHCSKRFASQSALNAHMQAKHGVVS